MRHLVRLVVVVVALGALFGGIFYWKSLQQQRMAEGQSAPRAPASVAAAEASREQWQPVIRSVGSAVAVSGVAVSTEVAGTVRSVEFESGERVSAGQVLVHLDDSVDQAALEALVADRELARVQFGRASELLGRGGTSRSDFDEARFRYASAQARVQEQQTRVAKKVIRAPFEGALGLRMVDPGEYLSPGDAVVTLLALHPIYVDYSVPEREFTRLAVGQSVTVRVPAYPDRMFTGAISAIDSGIAEATRSVAVRATLPNPERAVRPGMFAEVETLRPRMRAVVTVPRTAVSFNTYGDFVFVIEAGEGGSLLARRRSVTTGSVREGRVEISEGLEAGERVVRAGLVKLRDGQPVRIDDSVELDDAGIARP